MDMKSIISFLFLLQAIINGVDLAKAQNPLHQQHICRDTGVFKNNTLLESRDEAFEKVYAWFKNTSYTGFCHVQGGISKWEIKVAVIVLCPSNVKMEACQDCIKKTVPYLKQKCPNQKEGAAWTSLPELSCMVRYASDRSIYQELDDWGWVNFANPKPDGNAGDLEKALNNLATMLQGQAAGGGTLKKFASGTVGYGSGSRKLYGDMQCTPEITKEECIKCLSKATNLTHTCCTKKGQVSARMLSTNCFLRYVLQ